MTTTTLEKPARRAKTAAGITLATEALRRAMATVKAAVGSGNRPTLANVRIGDGVAEATDLELRISCEIEYAGEPILLPYQRLSAILSSGRDEQVTLSPAGTTCEIRLGRGSWTLPTEAVAE